MKSKIKTLGIAGQKQSFLLMVSHCNLGLLFHSYRFSGMGDIAQKWFCSNIVSVLDYLNATNSSPHNMYGPLQKWHGSLQRSCQLPPLHSWNPAPKLLSKEASLAYWTRDLAGVAQWTEHWPANWKVASWFPVRAHAWVVSQVPRWGWARGNQSMFLSYIDVSPPPFSFVWK